MSIECTFFMPPNGRQEIGHVSNIYPEDEAWFKANNVKLSMEELLTGEYACYADFGMKWQDSNEPIEAIEIDRGRTCEETLKALRAQCERMLK